MARDHGQVPPSIRVLDDANGVPGDALRDPPLIGERESNVIWAIVNDRQLAIVDAL